MSTWQDTVFLTIESWNITDGDKSLVRRAHNFAEAMHDGQTRRDSGQPYLTHPEHVASYAIDYVAELDEVGPRRPGVLIAAALLHDTLEDTPTSYDDLVREFGSEVADLVRELTNDDAEIARVGKTAYLVAKIPTLSPMALYIKLCDRLDNIRDYWSSPDQERARKYAEQTVAIYDAVDEEMFPALAVSCHAYAARILAGVRE